jgi:hypothetical protein
MSSDLILNLCNDLMEWKKINDARRRKRKHGKKRNSYHDDSECEIEHPINERNLVMMKDGTMVALFEVLGVREMSDEIKITTNYPDVKGVIPAGCRRKVVNLVHLMVYILKMETFVSNLSVVYIDKILSSNNSVMHMEHLINIVISCVCLASKYLDSEDTICGTSSWVDLMGYCMNISSKNIIKFGKQMRFWELLVLKKLDGRLHSTPSAAEFIQSLTGWKKRSQEWQFSIFLIDVFLTHTDSTNYLQREIAETIIDMVDENVSRDEGLKGQKRNKREQTIPVCGKSKGGPLYFSIIRSIDAYTNESINRYHLKDDPYFGVRYKHSNITSDRVRRKFFTSKKIK